MKKNYEINGKAYFQTELLIGQWDLINRLLQIVDFKFHNICELLLKLPYRGLLGIILTPEGHSQKKESFEALGDEIAEHLDMMTALQIFEDFLELCGNDFQFMFPIEFLPPGIEAGRPEASLRDTFEKFCMAFNLDPHWACWNCTVHELIKFTKYRPIGKGGHC